MAIVKLNTRTPSTYFLDRGELRTLQELQGALANVDLMTPPLDIDRVAAFLDIQVVREPMGDDMSGFLERRNGRWVAGVNAYHHKVRQRFSLAHEIAHFVLHRDQQGEFKDRTFARRNDNPAPMEREADQFAAELLMPTSSVVSSVRNGSRGLNDLANEFNVSSLAMRFRLNSLGYSLT
ncbi:MAG TPA: ImmA/IrrE family metallo-endopeptidase [Arenimonas sp.]|uniref:ImmA/IrrE family metallo-endopeptidase n=1 Tax=Arenimonas sp. TaxID=1872635 RepID=UPI002CB044A4|nr:ImmA/IrrE family metallo-endopeptidase [Arenimonas sp.]HMB57999.1 ImmA/IrrE family metallo-endopeptidase [Arenimonas sp.]